MVRANEKAIRGSKIDPRIEKRIRVSIFLWNSHRKIDNRRIRVSRGNPRIVRASARNPHVFAGPSRVQEFLAGPAELRFLAVSPSQSLVELPSCRNSNSVRISVAEQSNCAWRGRILPAVSNSVGRLDVRAALCDEDQKVLSRCQQSCNFTLSSWSAT
jgi:hypothetical protein